MRQVVLEFPSAEGLVDGEPATVAAHVVATDSRSASAGFRFFGWPGVEMYRPTNVTLAFFSSWTVGGPME
jgi:hypothetical protein